MYKLRWLVYAAVSLTMKDIYHLHAREGCWKAAKNFVLEVSRMKNDTVLTNIMTRKGLKRRLNSTYVDEWPPAAAGIMAAAKKEIRSRPYIITESM